MCVLKNWKQLFLGKLIPYLLGQEYGIYLFLFLTYIFTRYLRNIHKKKTLNPRKHPRGKVWTHKIPTRKNFAPTKYPREKMRDPRNTHEKKLRPQEGTVTRWHETHETHNGKRLTEFSTLVVTKLKFLIFAVVFFYTSQMFLWFYFSIKIYTEINYVVNTWPF